MTIPSSENLIVSLRDQYSAGRIFGQSSLNGHTGKSLLNNGFMGSLNVIFLSSNNLIAHEAPGCVAAPLVTMIAKNAITLGVNGQRDQPLPFRLYAPNQLSITTKHLAIGDITLVAIPEHGFISCKKLTLSKSTEEDPDHFEIVKSWLMDDDVEIETIHS